MRMGALRLSEAGQPETFLADNTNVSKLVHIRELEEASRRLERGMETESDLLQLLGPGTSLGGAHPKVVVQEGNTLYLAKFQSHQDTERVCGWEATMLDLAQKAGITDLLLVAIPGDAANRMLDRYPRLARDLGKVTEARRQTVLHAKEEHTAMIE
jgi:hypothetical protein